MSDEFIALVHCGTWTLVPPNPSQNLVENTWVFQVKRNTNGTITWYKARLVAKGFHQRPWLNYGETFNPMVKPTTVLLVISLALQRKWPLFQIDVNNIFLHGTLDEEVVMQQPVGFVNPPHPSYVCKLCKFLTNSSNRLELGITFFDKASYSSASLTLKSTASCSYTNLVERQLTYSCTLMI